MNKKDSILHLKALDSTALLTIALGNQSKKHLGLPVHLSACLSADAKI